MVIKTENQILDKVVAVNLNINIWSAKTKLRPEDFNHADLPPGNLASLGCKKVCDPKDLRIFGTLKARAVSLLDRHGIRFLGGWAIPDALSDEISDGLDVIATEFAEAKKEFLQKYDQCVQDWIQQNPGWESIIANSIVSKGYVSNKIGFSSQMFKVAPNFTAKNEGVKCGLTSAVDALPDTLLEDISKAAHDAYSKSYDGKSEITRKALAPLKNIFQKLSDLSFIDPRTVPVAVLIHTALERIPLRGAISGQLLEMLKGLLLLIADKQVLSSCSKNLSDGKLTHDEVLDSFITTAVKQKEAKAQTKENINKRKQSEPKKEVEPTTTMQLDSMGLW